MWKLYEKKNKREFTIVHDDFMFNIVVCRDSEGCIKLCCKKQSFGAGASQSRPFCQEPEQKKLRSFGSGSIIKEDE